VEQSVDGGWRIAGAGDRQHRTLDWNAVVGEVRRCLIPETPADGHGKLVLHSLRHIEPVQFIVK